MTPFDLKHGDFVILHSGYVYQVLNNPLASKTGLSLYGPSYSCLTHLDDYNRDFACETSDHFNIYKVLRHDINLRDYKAVAQHFLNGTQLSKSEMEDIKWDWKRSDRRPEFEKANLQNGYVVTTANKKSYMTMLDIHRRGTRLNLLISQDGYEDLNNYNQDLTHKDDSTKDIVKIEILNDLEKPTDRYLLWQREPTRELEQENKLDTDIERE